MTRPTGFPAPTETELKFSLDPADIATLKAAPRLAKAPVAVAQLFATYFDTNDHALNRAGFSLRLRRDGDRVTQTLKGASTGAAGLFARPETEHVLAIETVDETMLAAALPSDLYLAVSGHLVPIFTVATERTEWRIADGEAVIGVSLDQGWIDAAGERERVNEVEFELHQGAIGAVFGLADEIVGEVALHLEPEAKSARGYRLLGGQPLPPDRPGSFLAPATPADEAIAALTATLLGAIAIERKLVAGVGDEPAVHRLRVLLRRLRSLIDIAGETIVPRRLGKTARIIRRAFKRLGGVRDLDILAAAIPRNAEAAEAALLRIGQERATSLAKARRLLVSRRFAAALLQLLALAAGVVPLKAEKTVAGAPVVEQARRALGRRWRRVKRSEPPTRLGADARHQLRIDAKTLRYTSDFFETLYDSDKALKRRAKLDAGVRRLQDQLGTLNDRRNTERLARAHLGASTAAALGLASSGAPGRDSLAAADKAYEKLVRLKPYWR